MREGLDVWRATGAKAALPPMLTLLADAQKTLGRTREGLDTVSAALAAMEETGERLFESELYRIKGELSLLGSLREQVEEGESCFQKANRDSAQAAGKIIRTALFNKP